MVAAISALKQKKRRWQDVRNQNKTKYPVSGLTNLTKSIGRRLEVFSSNSKAIVSHPDYGPDCFVLSDGVGELATDGHDVDPYYKVNINGIVITLRNVGPTSGNRVMIKCPEAPDAEVEESTTTTREYKTDNFVVHGDDAYVATRDVPVGESLTDTHYFLKKDHVAREDLHGIELFLVKLGDGKDAIKAFYPRGAVQHSESSAFGLSMSNEVMPQGYCAYGDWDTTTKGWGVIWNELTPAQKQAMMDIEENNIYVENGEYFQWQWRFRSVRGIGCRWEFIRGVFDTISDYSSVLRQNVAFGGYVIPQGMQTTPGRSGRIPADRASYYNGDHHVTHTPHDVTSYLAQTDLGAKLPDRGHNGECYWYTIASTTRFNKGVYHPFRNPMGTAHYAGGADSSGGSNTLHYLRIWTNATTGVYSRKPERHLADLFEEATGYAQGEGGVKSTGVSWGDTGTYASLYNVDNDAHSPSRTETKDGAGIYAYDYIHPSQINDMRNSALPFDANIRDIMLDLVDRRPYLDRSKLGWEPLRKMSVEFVNAVKSSYGYSSGNNSSYVTFPLGTMKSYGKAFMGIEPRGDGTPFDSRTYAKPIGYISGGNAIFEISYARSSPEDGFDYVYLSPKYYNNTATLQGLTGPVWSLITFEQSDISLCEKTMVGATGTPAKIEETFDTNGVDHLLGGCWTALFPDGGDAFYFYPHKVINKYDRFKTSNGGASFSLDVTGQWYSDYNSWRSNLPASDAHFQFFNTWSSPYEPCQRNNVVYGNSLSNVWAASSADVQTSSMCQWLIGYPSTKDVGGHGEMYLGTELVNWILSPDGTLANAINQFPAHDAINLPGQSEELLPEQARSAAKWFGMFTIEGSRIFLTIYAQEMFWDADKDNGQEAIIVDHSTFASWTKDTLYQVQGGPFAGSWYCVEPSSSKLSDSGAWTRDGDGNLRSLGGTINFVPWRGQGWGDRGRFNTSPNFWYREEDLNSTTVMVTRHRSQLPVGYIHKPE